MFNFIAFASFGKNIFLTFLTSPRNVGDLDFTGFGQHKPIYPMVKALQNPGEQGHNLLHGGEVEH